jgi:hypothetical protein
MILLKKGLSSARSNMAEIELSEFNNHGLPKSVPTMEQLKRGVAAWERQRNDSVKK